jgi:hypothetical protein
MATGADYQYEINGLLIGRGTPYKVMNIDGLFALPDVLSSDEAREGADGERSADNETLAGRTITIDITMLTDEVAPLTNDDLYEDLQAATSDIKTPLMFRIKRPGRPERFIEAKIRRRAFQANYEFSTGMAAGAVQLKALDPRIYSSDLESLQTVLQSLTGGRSYPLSFPRSYGAGAAAGTLTATNDGTYPTPVVLTVTGPLQDPIIEHIEKGRVLEFEDITLAAGEELIIDTGRKTALLNGVTSRRNLMKRAEWFLLDPGDNNIRFSSAISGPGQTGTLDIEFRSAWA